MKRVLSLSLLVASLGSAYADDEGSYRAGYESGYTAGYQAGLDAGTIMPRGRPLDSSGTYVWKPADPTQPGTVLLPGKNFSTTIDPASPNSAFTFNPDSSVAIIPPPAMDEIRQKMGSDFIQKNMMLNNPP